MAMQREIKSAILPKYGFNRNTPSAIVYRSTTNAGIGLQDLILEKDIS